VTPGELAAAVLDAAHRAFIDCGLDTSALPADARVERPRNPDHGDYVSTVAMRAAAGGDPAPREPAAAIADRLCAIPGIKSVEVAGPGFLNIRVDPASAGHLAAVIVECGEQYGHSDTLAGQRIGVEGASVGPVLSIPLGYARRVVVADALARILAAVGAEVDRERHGSDRTIDCTLSDLIGQGSRTDRDQRSDLPPGSHPGSPSGPHPGSRPESRCGDTFGDLIDAVGVDVARYSLVRVPVDTPLAVDPEFITRHVSENPVYLVWFCAARTASVVRNAEAVGLSRGATYDPGLLGHHLEWEVTKALGEFPDVVATAAQLREPHRVARYLEILAGSYHRMYEEDGCRVLPKGDARLTESMRSRLWLTAATRVVITNGLELLGVSVPEQM
jgi:arginyl-tRNA synthetase